MTAARFVVVRPPKGGLQPVAGATRYLYGGDRYRALGDETLAAHGEVRHLAWAPGTPLDEIVAMLDEALADAEALVMAPWLLPWPGVFEFPPFDAARFDPASRLAVIAGTWDFRLGWIDVDEASRRGITVVDTSRSMTPTVAEFGVGITLALLRDIPGAIDVVRRGEWFDGPKGQGRYIFRDLADCRIGLAGYGSINRHYRRFVAPYGCEVASFDPLVPDEVFEADGVRQAGSLVELAQASDILVVAIPPTPSTLGVIDADTIDALADGSLFVLLSRMAVVDQEALWRRVRAEEIRAAVDVFDPEPPPTDAWFRRAANVLPTHHIAGHVVFAHERCFTEACADAARVLGGEAPRYAATVRDKGLYVGRPST